VIEDKNNIPLNVGLITVSDTRSYETDTSGDYLANAIKESGHVVAERKIVIDDVYLLRAQVSNWIADNNIHAMVLENSFDSCLLMISERQQCNHALSEVWLIKQ